MKIAVMIPRNRRVPGVVTRGRKPRRGTEGDTVCQMVIAVRTRKITIKKIAVGHVQYIQSRIISAPLYTRPRAKPLAIWLRTNQITRAPGTRVSIPAAASRPQSIPVALMVRVMTA